MPLVSVVMAHFEAEPFLAAAVRSILSQTLGDLELIVIDDGSAGMAWRDVLRSFADETRLKIFRTDRNVGNYALKAQALRLTDSAFIAFQDADDVSMPERLARQVAALDDGLDVVGTSFAYLDAHGRITSVRRMPRHAGLALKLGRSFAMLHPTQMMRRTVMEHLGGFDRTMRIAGDHDFLLRASLDHRLGNLPEVLYGYRVHPNALTQAKATGHGSPARKAVAAAIRRRHLKRLLARPFVGPEVCRVTPFAVPLEHIEFRSDNMGSP